MTRLVLLVGNEVADPLISCVKRQVEDLGLATHVVSPVELAVATVCATADRCLINGQVIAGAVFRAAPSLLVAPGFAEDDASFAAAEVRAVWAHVLSIPGLAAVNRAWADTWFASSDWAFWHRRLKNRGVPMAPRRLGRSGEDGWWVRWTGGIDRAPTPEVSERLGLASIGACRLHRILCCAGEAIDGGVSTSAAIARMLLSEGIVLAEAITDDEGRMVALNTLPPLVPDSAAEVASRLARWIHACVNR